MRAWEFMTETERQPDMTLQQINTAKKEMRHRQNEIDKRNALIPIMYANSTKELERIELEKAYIELEQLKTELALSKAEAKQQNKNALYKMALSGIEFRNNTDE